MGCPDKVSFPGAGAGLILQPKLAKEIILSVKKPFKIEFLFRSKREQVIKLIRQKNG